MSQKPPSANRELFPELSEPSRSATPSSIPRPQVAPRAQQGMLMAHIDGGARGNPGPAGYGVYLQDAQGRRVAELSRYLGRQTNNFAEYSALLAALEYALQHGHPALRVYSDSELLVKQIKGQYKVRNQGLLPLYQRAQRMMLELEDFRIEHVRREQNRDADRLANVAMDEGTRRR